MKKLKLKTTDGSIIITNDPTRLPMMVKWRVGKDGKPRIDKRSSKGRIFSILTSL